MQVQAEKILARGGKVILKISRAMAIIAAVVLAFMMILTVIDVCGREFFLKPVQKFFFLKLEKCKKRKNKQERI